MCLKYHVFNCPSFTNINLFTGMVTKYTKYSTIRIFIRLKKKNIPENTAGCVSGKYAVSTNLKKGCMFKTVCELFYELIQSPQPRKL